MARATNHYGNYQFGIYMAGQEGQLPSLPLRYEDLEARAREVLDSGAYWYVAGGAGEASMAANRNGFDRYPLMPRVLTDVSERDLGTTVLGKRRKTPIMLAPLGVQEILHDDAEMATARAAAQLDVPMILSTVSSNPMEDVKRELGETAGWYQLYWPNDDALAASLVQRAEKAGYEAIVITLDTKMLAWRERDLDGAYLPFLEGKGLANYTSDPVFCAGLDKPPADDVQATVRHWSQVYASPERSWPDLAKLRELSESVQQTLRQTVGAVDVRDNLGALKPEIALYPDRGAIEFYDLTPQKLAAQVRYGMSTGEIGKFAVSGPRTISTSCSAWTGPADRAVVSVRPKPKHCPCCGRSRRTATPSRFRRCWCRAWTMRRYRSCTRRPAARSSSWPRKRTGR